MSAHRDLVNAQQALNEAVERTVSRRNLEHFSVEALARDYYDLCKAWDTFDAERQRLDAPGGAAKRNTSINAAHANLFGKESLRRSIVMTVVAHHAEYRTGMTVAELKARLRKEHSSVSSAINALMERGWLKDSGVRRNTQYGQPAIVWEPTELAISKCREVALEVASE